MNKSENSPPPPTPPPPPAPPADSASPARKSKPSKSAKSAPSTPWRDNLEAGVMAILLALFLKAFLVEAYKIPSGSMQPTLMGMPSPGDAAGRTANGKPLEVNDRILVDKFTYKVTDPKRWDVVVFRYPLKRTQNFVKRLVGLPGDQLRIRHGDLWRYEEELEDYAVLRRPEGVQSSHWRALDTGHPTPSRWSQASGSGWLIDGTSIAARGDGAVQYDSGSAIVDRYYDGYPEAIRTQLPARHPTKEQEHKVGDLRVTSRVSATDTTESVTFTLTEGPRRYSFTLPGPAAAADQLASIEVDPPSAAVDIDRVEVTGIRLASGRATDVEVENLDDRLTLRVDGEIVAELEVNFAFDQTARILVQARGAEADIDNLRVYRDIFYFATRGDAFELPEDGYFAMGDNTLDSSDSREWRRARYEVNGEVDADGEPLVMQGNLRRGDNPSRARVDHANGRIRRFTDEWGVHRLIQEQPGASQEVPDWLTPVTELESEESPFIDRSLIVGRALAVFWPLAPHKGIYRLRWIR